MKTDNSIMMDMDYSRALLGSALETGMANIIDPEGNLNSFNIKGDAARSLVNHRATRKLRSAALQMALLFDKVDLTGVHPYISTEPLKREGLVRASFNLAVAMPDGTGGDIPARFVWESKSWLLRPALRRVNYTLRWARLDQVTYRTMSWAFDAIEHACAADINLARLKDTLEKYKIQGVEPTTLNQEHVRAIAEAYIVLLGVCHLNSTQATFCLMSAIAEIESAWNLCVMSTAFSIPFLSNRPNLGEWEIKKDPKVSDTVSLCQLAMHEELGYAPSVTSIEDVLRLRYDKRIVRFRELLFEWHKNLSCGNAKMLTKMKTDIRKANKDLRHLKKWKTVDRWLFWAQLPTALIPVLSTIVTVASVGTHLWIEKKEHDSSWVAIGR